MLYVMQIIPVLKITIPYIFVSGFGQRRQSNASFTFTGAILRRQPVATQVRTQHLGLCGHFCDTLVVEFQGPNFSSSLLPSIAPESS